MQNSSDKQREKARHIRLKNEVYRRQHRQFLTTTAKKIPLPKRPLQAPNFKMAVAECFSISHLPQVVAMCLLVTLLLAAAVQHVDAYSDNGKMSAGGGGGQNHIGSPDTGALFNTRNYTKVVVQRGGLANLPCVIKWNPSATVSWIRRQDFQLLTVGLSTYSSDERFQVEHTRHMGHWSLRIKAVRDEDRGLYECQLSVHPTQSIFVELQVIEAIAEIIGSSDLHIDEGSTLRLECTLRCATENPAFVFWYLNHKMINYDTQDGFSVSSSPTTHSSSLGASSSGSSPVSSDNAKISGSPAARNATSASSSSSSAAASSAASSLFSSAGPTSSTQEQQQHKVVEILPPPGSVSNAAGGGSGAQTHQHSLSQHQQQQQQQQQLQPMSTSVLTIQEVHFRHAGNYTCAPSNARPTSITVHVLKSEKPAAMQHANRSAEAHSSCCRLHTRGWSLVVAVLITALGPAAMGSPR